MAQSITALKAAELSCHRVERLVLQKKIDKTYLSKFQKLTVIPLHDDPNGGAFAVTAYQMAPVVEGANPFSVTILLDSSGMVLKYAVNEGGTAGADINWSGKDPISLTEAGLHYVLDNQKTSEDLKPFAANFESLVLEQKSVNGNITGELKMSNTLNSSKLILTLDPNGKLINKEVVPQ
jgi:hypothetical protein